MNVGAFDSRHDDVTIESTFTTPIEGRKRQRVLSPPVVETSTPVRPLTPPRGLKNQGNTCFANALLQALAHSPGLGQNLADCYGSSNRGSTGYFLLYLLRQMATQGRRNVPVDLDGLKALFQNLNAEITALDRQNLTEKEQAERGIFLIGQKGDSHELFLKLASQAEDAFSVFHFNMQKQYKVFSGELQPKRPDSSFCVELQLPAVQKGADWRLSTLLEEWMNDHTIQHSDIKIDTDSGDQKPKKVKVQSDHVHIDEPPKELAILLKRPTDGNFEQKVFFDEKLYLTTNTGNGEKKRHGYQLYAVIVRSHQDGTHFFCYVCQTQQSVLGETCDDQIRQWYRMNDSSVGEVKRKTVKDDAARAFMLFYEAIPQDSTADEDPDEGIIDLVNDEQKGAAGGNDDADMFELLETLRNDPLLSDVFKGQIMMLQGIIQKGTPPAYLHDAAEDLLQRCQRNCDENLAKTLEAAQDELIGSPVQPVRNHSDPPPRTYKLFEVGEEIPRILFGGQQNVTVDGTMLALLGEADNTIACIPGSLVNVARHLIASIVLNSIGLVQGPWEARETIQYEGDEWTSPLIMHFDTSSHGHLLAEPEQFGKSIEMAFLALYLFLVCGVAPILTVRAHGGRMPNGGGEQMEQTINCALSPSAGERGNLPTIRDHLDHVLNVVLEDGQDGDLSKNPAGRNYFFMRAILTPPGKNTLTARAKASNIAVQTWEIPIVLQNKAGIEKLQPYMINLRDEYGSKSAKRDSSNEATYRARVALINDEDDLNFSGAARESAANQVEKTMNQYRGMVSYDISVTATPATILASDLDRVVYVRTSMPSTYYGLRNGRVDWHTHPFEGGDWGYFRQGQHIVTGASGAQYNFPSLGYRAATKLLGARGCNMDGKTMAIATSALVDMLENIDAVKDGWRHANVYFRTADSQQYAAMYFASLRFFPLGPQPGNASHAPIVTFEWHSKHVKTDIVKKQQAAVRMYFPIWLWEELRCQVNVLPLGIAHYLAPDGETELTAEYLCEELGVVADQDEHCDIVQVELREDIGLRDALLLLHSFYAQEPGTTSVARNMRIMCVSGDINGRQMPNKSSDHRSMLTDMVYWVPVTGEGFQASRIGADVSQNVSRICTQSMVPVGNPKLHTTPQTRQYVANHHDLASEFIYLSIDYQRKLSNESKPTLRNLLKMETGGLDPRLYPLLSARIDFARENGEFSDRQLGRNPRAAKLVGSDLASAPQPTERANSTHPERRITRRGDFQNTAPAQPPQDPVAAQAYRAEAHRRRIDGLLTQLKCAAKSVWMPECRTKDSYHLDGFKVIMNHWKPNVSTNQSGHRIPDLSIACITDDEIDKLDSLNPATDVKKIVYGGHYYQHMINAADWASEDAPGGIFRRWGNGSGWGLRKEVHEELLKLFGLRKKPTHGRTRNLALLWTGQNQYKAGKHKQACIMRDFIRSCITPFVEKNARMPIGASELPPMSKAEVEAILNNREYAMNERAFQFRILHFVESPATANTRRPVSRAWAVPVLSQFTGRDMEELFFLHEQFVKQILAERTEQGEKLTMDNLEKD